MNECKENLYRWVKNVLGILAWVSAILFFWSSLRQEVVWGFDALYYAWVVVILVLLSLTKGICRCCWKRAASRVETNATTCRHEGGCACGDCGRCK